MTDLYIPKHQAIEIGYQSGAGVAGRYKLTKGKNLGYIDASTGLWIPGREVVTGGTGWFNNIITNNGLNDLADTFAQSLTAKAHVGSGNTAPSASDTTMANWVAASDTINVSATSGGSQSSAPYYGYDIRCHRFNEGNAEGNLAEVGVGPTTSNSDLFSRALIVDGNGDPDTITVLSDEWLDVTYEYRNYPDHINSDGSTNDGTGSIVIDGVTYNYTIRPSYVNNLVGGTARGQGANLVGSIYEARVWGTGSTLGGVTELPTGTPANGADDITNDTYSAGTYNRDCTWEWGLTSGNVTGGIKCMQINGGFGEYQISFDTQIPKDDTKVLTYTHNIAWARATIT